MNRLQELKIWSETFHAVCGALVKMGIESDRAARQAIKGADATLAGFLISEVENAASK